MERREIDGARRRQADHDRFSPLRTTGAAWERTMMFWITVSIVGAYMIAECAAESASGDDGHSANDA